MTGKSRSANSAGGAMTPTLEAQARELLHALVSNRWDERTNPCGDDDDACITRLSVALQAAHAEGARQALADVAETIQYCSTIAHARKILMARARAEEGRTP